jgi:hypothetical protein
MGKKLLAVMSLTVLVLSLAVIGCSSEIDPGIITFTDAAMENVLVSLNEKDYENYSKDMDDAMLQVVTKDSFTTFSDFLKDTIGEYREDSMEYLDSYTQGGYYVVIYNTDYTNETENVMVKVVLSEAAEGIYKISGTWFDSPKLREVEYEE